MRVIVIMMVLAQFFSVQSFGGSSFSSKCPDLASCIKAVSEITGQKYIFDSSVKGKVEATSNMEINRDNAELLLTKALHFNGYTRVPLGYQDAYQIAQIRDARDGPLPEVKARADKAPRFPNVWDLYKLVYKVGHPDALTGMKHMAKNSLPQDAKITYSEINNTLIIISAAPELMNVYRILKELDKEPSPELLKAWAEREKESKQNKQDQGKKKETEAKSSK